MVGGASVHIYKHSLFRLEITVGCRLCAYPSIHEDILKITVGCRLCAYPKIHFFVSRSRSVARRAHIQAFATKTCTRAGLLGPHRGHTEQRQRTRETTERHHTRDNGHVRQQSAQCDMMMVVHFCLDSGWSSAVLEAQSDAPLQVRHRGCGCRSWRHTDDLRLRRRVWHGRVVLVV